MEKENEGDSLLDGEVLDPVEDSRAARWGCSQCGYSTRFMLYWKTTTSTSTATSYTSTSTLATATCTPSGFALSPCGR